MMGIELVAHPGPPARRMAMGPPPRARPRRSRGPVRAPRPGIAGIRPHGTTRHSSTRHASPCSAHVSQSRPDSSGHVSAVDVTRHVTHACHQSTRGIYELRSRRRGTSEFRSRWIDRRTHGRSVRHHGWTNQTGITCNAVVAVEGVCAHTTASCRLTLPSSCSARVWLGRRHATSRGSSWHLARAR